jgi:hypothetical protein
MVVEKVITIIMNQIKINIIKRVKRIGVTKMKVTLDKDIRNILITVGIKISNKVKWVNIDDS